MRRFVTTPEDNEERRRWEENLSTFLEHYSNPQTTIAEIPEAYVGRTYSRVYLPLIAVALDRM
jgi:hypothetical protein